MQSPFNGHAWAGSNQAPSSQGWNRGYDIEATRLRDRRLDAAQKRANAFLYDGTTWISMFVTDLNIDLSLAGSTAQSRTTRDFYPHNFVQPSFALQGQSLSQEDYGKLCEWIHQSQHGALSGSQGLTQLFVAGGGYRGGHNSHRNVSMKSSILGNKNLPNRMIRGVHQPVRCKGYVGSMQRQHQAGVYAPTWQLEFVVAEMIEGPYNENLKNIRAQKTWVDMLSDLQMFPVNKKLKQENTKNLKWAAQNSSNIINAGN